MIQGLVKEAFYQALAQHHLSSSDVTMNHLFTRNQSHNLDLEIICHPSFEGLDNMLSKE